MKKLVVFYSLEGHTKQLAEGIAEAASADLLQVKPKEDIPTKGFMKYLKGGKQARRKETPELLPVEIDPQEYDLIFLGSPVWAGAYAPALRTFISNADLEGKKVALFVIHRGGKGPVYKWLHESLEGSEIIGEKDFNEKKGMRENVSEAGKWAQEIVNSL